MRSTPSGRRLRTTPIAALALLLAAWSCADGGSPSLEGLHRACGPGAPCAPGQTCLEYFGIAGPRGPAFHSCEIPCADRDCPAGLRCAVIADGPGNVCVVPGRGWK
jgi:hypothetical protein